MPFQAKLAWFKSTFRVPTLRINVEAYGFLSLYNLYWYEFIYLFYWFHTSLILSIIWWCSILLQQKHSISSPRLAQTGASISLSNAERDKKMRQLNLGHLLSLFLESSDEKDKQWQSHHTQANGGQFFTVHQLAKCRTKTLKRRLVCDKFHLVIEFS